LTSRHRDDSLSALRHYSRGYVAGAFAAWSSEIVALEQEALAGTLLAVLGVPVGVTRNLLDQARYEARQAAPPNTSDHDVRALGAQRVVLLVAAGLQRRASGAAESHDQ